MKFLLPPALLASLLLFVSFIPGSPSPSQDVTISPLSDYSPLWNNPKYVKYNTAINANYMSAPEKEVIYILNLFHADPALFTSTVIKQYPVKSGSHQLYNSGYYKSLLDTMMKVKPLRILYPDSLCFAGADCHAITSGQEGYVGHERRNEVCKKKWYYSGECCDYGHSKPLDIVMSLLIDEGVESLGHRYIFLGNYRNIGVSIQPHKSYFFNTVIDFHY